MRNLALSVAFVCFALPSSAEIVIYTFQDEGDLYRVPVGAAAPLLVGPTGYLPIAMDFGPDGVLYAVEPVSDLLLTIDESSAAATVVGPLGVDIEAGLSDISFDPSGQLWMNSRFLLFTVDTNTGAASFVVDSDPIGPVGGWIGLAWAGGSLYADSGWLHRVDPSTGTATPIDYNWAYVGMDSDARGRLWVNYQFNAIQTDYYAIAVVNPGDDSLLDRWDFAASFNGYPPGYIGIAIKEVAEPAIPTAQPWGLVLLSALIATSALWVIRGRRG